MKTNEKKAVRRILLVSIVMIAPLFSFGQAENAGIHFENGLSWEQVKVKAKSENKYIFMDCFATWCGPCKAMDREVFPQKQVGDYFNAHFISVRVQMDRTSGDAPQVKDWYTDAKYIGTAYEVHAYPTYLFFNTEGIAVHHADGAIDAKAFISVAKDAFDPSKQYYAVMNQWEAHKLDSAFLYHALVDAIKVRDKTNIAAIGKAYIDILKDPFTKDNLEVISYTINSPKDTAFMLFVNNEDRINRITGDTDFAKKAISPIIYKDEIRPMLTNDQSDNVWRDAENKLKGRHPMLKLWKTRSTDSAFLAYALDAAINSYDEKNKNVKPLADAFLTYVRPPYRHKEISIIHAYVNSTKDAEFNFLLHNQQKIDEVLGAGYVGDHLTGVIFKDELDSLFLEKHKPVVYEKGLTDLQRQYPKLSELLVKLYSRVFNNRIKQEVSEALKRPDGISSLDSIKSYLARQIPRYDFMPTLLQCEAEYYADRNQWPAYENVTYLIFHKYGDQLSDGDLNDHAWDIFVHGNRQDALQEALKWMKISVDRAPHGEALDTYANLLYKSGQTKEAILWENKALEVARKKESTDDERDVQTTLAKMSKGEPTWIGAH